MALDIGVFLDTIKNLFKSKVSSNDSQPDYLINKFTSSDASVTITETNDGGIEQINLQSAGGTDTNFANTDLTLTGKRTHDLAGFDIDYNATSGSVINKQFDDIKPTTLVTLEKWYGTADGSNYYYAIKGGGGNASSVGGFSVYRNNLRIASLGYYNNSGAVLDLRDNSSNANIFINPLGNSFHVPDLVVGKVSVSPSAKLQVVGNGNTSATTALLVENSSGDTSFSITDDRISTFQNSSTGSFLSMYRSVGAGGNAFLFDLNNSTSTRTNYAAIVGSIETNTASSEDGKIGLRVKVNGSDETPFELSQASGTKVKLITGASNSFEVSDGSVSNLKVNSSGVTTIQKNNGLALNVYRATNGLLSGQGVNFDLNNSASTQTTYGRILSTIQVNTASSEGGALEFWNVVSGTLTKNMSIDRGNIIMPNLPTSSAGLPTGALWNNSGVINIV